MYIVPTGKINSCYLKFKRAPRRRQIDGILEITEQQSKQQNA